VIEPTDEMKAAVAKRMGVPDGAAPDPWMEPAIQDVLNIIERDYTVRPRRKPEPFCGVPGPDGLYCQRSMHKTGSHGYSSADTGLVRW
jgi:hypothetical protein